MSKPVGDPDIDDAIAAGVDRGEFATVEDARADFWAKLDESIAQADRGELHDIEDVRAWLHQRYANWPRAAERRSALRRLPGGIWPRSVIGAQQSTSRPPSS